jgi:Domain of unknown function (DUF5666)
MPGKNTEVTLVLSGVANDQLIEFNVNLQSLSLTSASGKMVSLLSTEQTTEFMHINGGIEPLITVSVPQDVYTSATATVGSAQFTCASLTPQGGIDTSTFAYGQTPSANVTVNLPAPITIAGDSMGLSVDLLVAQSESYPTSCYINGIVPFSITPTFNVAPIAFSAQPTNSGNGGVSGLNGQISSINAANGSFVVTLPLVESPRTVNVTSLGSTVYQGIGSFSDLAVGSFVNMDGGIQPDGSLVATRIAIEDTTATTAVTGPLFFVSEAEPAMTLWGLQEQGALYANGGVVGGQDFSFGNATFQISGQLSNLQNLPFVPTFDSSNMVAGQNLYLTTTAVTLNGGFPYVPVTTVTLIPQTIDGTVTGSSTVGNLTVYDVSLASYDLFPTFATQAGQTTLLTNPSDVEVYVDGNTQELNSQILGPGSTLRFYGLVFNDNGTLRMDCAQISDGVSETPQAQMYQRNHLQNGQVKVVASQNTGPIHMTSRLITPEQSK